MTEYGEPHRSADSPRPRDLLAAIGLLTALPLPRPDVRSEAFARATLFFPLVGLLHGAVLAGLNWLMTGRLHPWMVATVLVATWEVLGWNRERLSTLAGRAAWVAAPLAKIVCLTAAARARPAALLFAPMLARWCMVVLATGERDAGAPMRKFNPSITFREFALTSVFSFALLLALADAIGILVVVSVSAATLAVRLLAHRWVGGVTWAFLSASARGMEVLVLLLFALL